MHRIDKDEYKVGDVAMAAIFITAGFSVVRIDRSVSKSGKVRILFVFDKEEVTQIELDYLSYNCQVDARKYIDTISNLRTVIRNTVNNIVE